MKPIETIHWKQLWRWVSSQTLTEEELLSVLDKNVVEALRLGLASYKQQNAEKFVQLQAKHPDQTKLLNIVQTLQKYIDIDCFQLWEVLKHYLCDISYGTPANALKNVAFVDTRPAFLLPNAWNFYYSERLFLLKLLQYILEFKSDRNHKYNEVFNKIIKDIGIENLKTSLISQFEKVLSVSPPLRRIQNDFGSDSVRQDWAHYNLKEQLVILQIFQLIANEHSFSESEFVNLLKLFRKHNFGKNQGYNDFIEERHREACLRVMYMEVGLFTIILNVAKINNKSDWIDKTKETVECELTKLEPSTEHSLMLLTWMMLTLQSETHSKLFESEYHHYGATALRMRVFEFIQQMLKSSVFSDGSKCALIFRLRVFQLLNELCDKFDGDGTLSQQPGIMGLCADLFKTPIIAEQFWALHQKEEEFGVISIWNTALEYFPYNFSALSILSSGLAEAGKESVRNLIAELKNLPVYSEIYNPNEVPIMLQADDAIIGREYYPLGAQSYRIEMGSKATIMERKNGTMIHYRTPYSYWTIFNNEIEKALDRKHSHQNINVTLERVYEGTKVLRAVLKTLAVNKEIPKSLVAPSEGVFDVLVRFMRSESPPLPLLVECLHVCISVIPVFPNEVHLRLINTGLLPRITNQQLSHEEYAAGASLDSAAVGSYLVTIEQPTGTYNFLGAYIDMLCAFHEVSDDDRIITEIILPGLVLISREVFPNVCGWRYINANERRTIIQRCAKFLTSVLQQTGCKPSVTLLRKTCVYSLTHTENALELLKIISIGNDRLERQIQDDTNWISGHSYEYTFTLQRCIAIVMFALRQKSLVGTTNEVTPLEHLIFAQNKHNDELKVVPKVTSYINHAFNKSLSVLSCRLLKRFADGFQMSLFASLDMTAYHVRVMFLDRLRDEYETLELKIAILEFVATCIGKQPGLTEAFFMMNYENAKEAEKNVEKNEKEIKEKPITDESYEGILGYMADYLGTIKADAKLLHSPLLSCMMALFHALWKNNMQILIKKLREHSKFWEHMTSPLFSPIQPGLRTYAQIFNVLGIELFVSRGKLEANLREMLEQFFDTNKRHLDTWIDYIFSFKGRFDEEELVDKVSVWLGLLTSWKDFTTIFCKCLPISLNIAHKAKMVAPCMNALLNELDELKDGRLVVILAELYVIMLANWKDDCFDNRKTSAKQIDNLLTNTAIVYECLHPRAIRAILSIGTVAITSLDYEIKANSVTAQSIIRSVTNINSLELEKLFDEIRDDKKVDTKPTDQTDEIPPIVLSLAMLEQCLDLYDDMFSGLSHWFQSTKFVNKLLCCLQICLQNRRHYQTSLAALRCLTAYSRGPFSKDLLMSDVDQFLWMQLLPPKIENNPNGNGQQCWKAQEWWRVYAYSLDFISMMVMKHGQFFAGDAITFVGVHLEHLIEAVLLPRQVNDLDALNLCASTLNLVVQLVKFENRWRIENMNSLIGVMRSTSVCLQQCVVLVLRARRPHEPAAPPTPAPPPHDDAPAHLHRVLEILHMATLCLLAFSPDLLSLLADPTLDLERWQPIVELSFGAPKISHEQFPQLTFGTILSAICLLTKSLNHAYQSEEASGARSPRGRRRAGAGGGVLAAGGGVLAAGGAVLAAGGAVLAAGSPGERRTARSESVGSISSAASALPAPSERLVAGALEATVALLASQALLAVRDPNVPGRHKQLVRRELASELTVFHDFVRKRILCAAHTRPHLIRNKLGAWPLPANEEEARRIEEVKKERDPCLCLEDDKSLPPPPPPKRSTHDSMREYILRKHYLDKCAQTPTKDPPSPVSHSTPTSDKKKDSSRSSKRVSWAETTRNSDENLDNSLQPIEPMYSNLTDVQINNDEDYFHFMSIVFLYICQSEL